MGLLESKQFNNSFHWNSIAPCLRNWSEPVFICHDSDFHRITAKLLSWWKDDSELLYIHSHVTPGCDTTLIDAAGQVDQLAVVVLQAVVTEGFINTLAGHWHGQTLVER